MAKHNYVSELFLFAFFPKYDDAINKLANEIAAKDDQWEFSDALENKNSILKNYLEHTYRKLKSEGKIAHTQNNAYSCFNTGLQTPNLEEIFAFFESHNGCYNPKAIPFCFKSFLRASDNKLLGIFNGNLPEIADYFQKPEDLIFNPNCNIIPQIDHIIEENKERFPSHMQNIDNAEIMRKLEGAINEAKKKVRTNYKIAVPQFYDNKIQLLIPLYLTPGSPNPDLALVTHKINATTYTARTCLTLKMAYNNARLIVKPQSSWLKP